MAQALVTGGAGFIGSHLVRALRARGMAVRVLDDLSTGSRANLEGVDIELVVGDICEAQTAARAVRGVEFVFHLAARISTAESLADPLGYYQANVLGSLNVLWAARQAGVQRVVLSSSCAVYGNQEGKVAEQAATSPITPYAASKLAMEDLGRLFTHTYAMPAVSLRYFNVYGPRQAPDSPYAAVIPLFIRTMLAGRQVTIDGDGRQTRDFVFVEDVVRANLLAVEHDDVVGGAFNVSGGRSVTICDLADYLAQMIPDAPPPAFGPPRPGDIRNSAASLERAERALGFRPQVDLQEGLRATVAWLSKNLGQVEA
jgi:UDP-glucose 4-epimerase